ncbi:MAG: hypothetical protein MI757_22900 [Pirellulales bacterium]|nr:hypothetical protein [Pirellulales bacterium]
MRESRITIAYTLLVIWCQSAIGNRAHADTAPPLVDARSVDEQFLAGLRERQLFDLAEDFCRRELAKQDLADRRRARMTIELARALSGKALDSPRDRRDQLWQQAFDVLNDYRARQPTGGFVPLVEYRRVALQLKLAEIAREEAALAGNDEAAARQVQQQLRAAIKDLRAFDESLAKLLRSPNVERDPSRGLTKDQLSALRNNTRLQLGRAYRNQAETYPAGSADRVNAIGQADELFKELAEIDSSASYVWAARVERMRAARLAGAFDAGSEMVRLLLLLKPAERFEQAIRAEQLRLLAARPNTIDAAMQILAADRKAGRVRSGDLALAQLEAQVAAWRAAKSRMDAPAATRLLEEASATLSAIRNEYPGYWALRAGRVLDTTDQSSILVRSAATYYHEGRFDEAIKAYESAAKKASGDPSRQFELMLIAAKIEHGRERWAEAVRRYRTLALAAPKHATAAATHLTAIQLAAAKLKTDRKLYRELLDEHVANWPTNPPAGEAYVRLGQLAEIAGDWIAAIGAYMQVPRGNPQQLEAIRGVSRCVAPLIAAAQAKNQRTDKLASDAAKYFESVVRRADGTWPEQFNGIAQEASLAAARIRLQHVANSEEFVEQLLAAALTRAVEPAPAWQQEVQMLSVVALAMQGKAAQARERIAKVTSGSPVQLLALLTGIHRAASRSSGSQAKAMAQLQLDVVKLLKQHRAKLTKPQQRELVRREAEALATSGNRNGAIALYARLAADNPKDGGMQEDYAQLLLESPDKSHQREALQRWRLIERRSRPGTARWLRAKYALALAHTKLGDKAQAKKVVALTRVLAPDLGGAEMKAKFDALVDDAP